MACFTGAKNCCALVEVAGAVGERHKQSLGAHGLPDLLQSDIMK